MFICGKNHSLPREREREKRIRQNTHDWSRNILFSRLITQNIHSFSRNTHTHTSARVSSGANCQYYNFVENEMIPQKFHWIAKTLRYSKCFHKCVFRPAARFITFSMSIIQPKWCADNAIASLESIKLKLKWLLCLLPYEASV